MTHKHICAHVHICTCTYVHVQVNMFMQYVNICEYGCDYLYTHLNMYTEMHIISYIYMHTPNMHTYGNA